MMDTRQNTLHISGGTRLTGSLKVNTAKNSVLVLMLGSLLSREKVILQDVPRLSDILVMVELLRHFGAIVEWQGSDLHIRADSITTCEAPYHLVSKMRASFVALGALMGRCNSARMPMPGGCAFGPRPVDRHIKAFKAIGATILEEEGDFVVSLEEPLAGRVVFEAPTVGGTQNIILASVLGQGEVVIENAALEPEIIDLATMLTQMGADISGAGTSVITIKGVERLRGITYRAIPDRIEAGTLMLAVAATRGSVVFEEVNLKQLQAVIAKLNEAGVQVLPLGENRLRVDASGSLKPVAVDATEYPGIPTDLQAPFGAFLATIPGTSTVADHVYFGHRFAHVEPLKDLGAELELDGNKLTIDGGQRHIGTAMHAADIRAGGALIVAALAAEGKSVITGLEYIERGYAQITERLRSLGAVIHRESVVEVVTGTYGD